MINFNIIGDFIGMGIIKETIKSFWKNDKVAPISKNSRKSVPFDYLWRYFITEKSLLEKYSSDFYSQYEDEFKVALLIDGKNELDHLTKEDIESGEFNQWWFQPYEQCFFRERANKE